MSDTSAWRSARGQESTLLNAGDDSSYHTFYFNPEDGTPSEEERIKDIMTDQHGRAARHGPSTDLRSYRYTRDPKYLDTALRAARFFIEYLPEDHVAYWDFDVPIEEGTPRDSSASAIAACGMLEILEHLDGEDDNKGLLTEAVEKSMISLVNQYSTIGEARGRLNQAWFLLRQRRCGTG